MSEQAESFSETGTTGEQGEWEETAPPTKSTTARSYVVPQPVVSGVYLLFRERELIYVGKSKDTYGRVEIHRANGREFDYALIAPCADHDAGWVEAAMLKAMETRHNKTHLPRNIPLAIAPVGHHLAPPEAIPDIPTDPNKVLSIPSAEAIARGYRMAGRVRGDIKSGDLASIYLTPKRGKGAVRGVFASELRRWIDAGVEQLRAQPS